LSTGIESLIANGKRNVEIVVQKTTKQTNVKAWNRLAVCARDIIQLGLLSALNRKLNTGGLIY